MLVVTSSHGCVDTLIKYIYVIKPTLDLGVFDVKKIQGNNSIGIKAQLNNIGNRDITNFKIIATLENSLPVSEFWSDMINPFHTGAFQGSAAPGWYFFSANFEISPDNPPTYLCVEATKPNNEDDDNPSNNLFCIN